MSSKTNQAQVTAIAKLPLNARFWKQNKRLQEAKTTPFRSMKQHRDTATEAVRLLQGALIIMEGSIVNPTFGSSKLGPFVIPPSEFDDQDATKCTFGPHTRKAIEKFQSQCDRFIDVDGFAGIMTLRAMDMQLEMLDNPD